MKHKKNEPLVVIETFKVHYIILMLISLNVLIAQSESVENTNQVITDSLGEDSARTVTPILSLPQGHSPEGIAIDNLGNIYISNTKGENRSINEILLVGQNGSYSVFATLPGRGRTLGLVTDKLGFVYVAFKTEDPNTNGVFQIDRNGTPIHLAGSEEMGFPNALTFDDLGNLYVTDSYKGKNFEGSVWYYSKSERVFKLFIKDPLLDGGVPTDGPQFPLPGANGITFYPPNKLYIANTKKSSIICITIGEIGKEPTIELVKKDSLLMNIDGIVVDDQENIYGVLPPSTLGAIGAPPVPPLIKFDMKSGVVSPVVEDNSKFDIPTSLAFGKGKDNQVSLFITNAALQYGQPSIAGPGVVKVQLNVSGIGNE